MNRQRKPYPTATDADPFSGDFTQRNADDVQDSLPILQWWGGIPAAADPREDNPRNNGGWFMEAKSLAVLGIHDLRSPIPPFRYTTLKFGNKSNGVEGWIASTLSLCFVQSAFGWEEKETGRAFPPGEYEKRKATGTHASLRGRTRALVGVLPLLDAGHVSLPVMVSVRGNFSKSLNFVLKHLRAMSAEATLLRNQSGSEGRVPPEAFRLDVFASPMREVGSGNQTSMVALPTIEAPALLARDYLVSHLVPVEWRGAGGLWDVWAEAHGERLALRVDDHHDEEEEAPPPATTFDNDEQPRRLSPREWAMWGSDFVRKQAPRHEGQPRNGQEYLRRLERFGFKGTPDDGIDFASKVLGRSMTMTADITNGELYALQLLLNHNDALEVVDAFYPVED